MTSFTRLPRDPLQMALEWRAGRPGDAMEDDEFEGRAHPVCDSRAGQAGSFGAVVPGVRDFAADGVFVAAAVRKNTDADRGSRTESATARQSAAHGRRYRAAGGGVAPADRLGCQEAADSAARASGGAAARAHHPPDSRAPRPERQPPAGSSARKT